MRSEFSLNIVPYILNRYTHIDDDNIPNISCVVQYYCSILLNHVCVCCVVVKSAIDLSNANPARAHKEARRSTGHIMVTARYSNQQGSKSRQNLCQVQPTENVGSELQATEKTV